MMNVNKKLVYAGAALIALLLIGLLVVTIVKKSSEAALAVETQKTEDKIVHAIAEKLSPDDDSFRISNLLLDKQIAYKDKWYIAVATLADEPEESEARHMTYVLQREGDTFTLIGYSGDGFSANSFPGYTVPADLIKGKPGIMIRMKLKIKLLPLFLGTFMAIEAIGVAPVSATITDPNYNSANNILFYNPNADQCATPESTAGEPPNDYAHVKYNGGATVNKRTEAMLKTASGFFGKDFSITQGSYNAGGVAASGGTHDGGGAADISVTRLSDTEINAAVKALRQAGFAAWFRDPSEGNWGAHIHAIAIGDKELAPVAATQVKNYFDGRSGLSGGGADRHLKDIGRPIPAWAEKYGKGTVTGESAAAVVTSTSASDNSTTLPEATVKHLKDAGVDEKAKKNIDRYKAAEKATGVPWYAVAALHYREAGMNTNQSLTNGATLGSGTNVDGLFVDADANKDAINAAGHLISMAKMVYKVDLKSAQPSDTDKWAKAFLAYNRGFMYERVGATYDTSPYVMNGYDAKHENMKWPASRAEPSSTRGRIDGNKVGALAAMTYLGKLSVGSSTGDCAGTATAGNGSIIDTVKQLAWPEPVADIRGGDQKSRARKEYQSAMPEIHGEIGSDPWTDCGVFVSTVMRFSKADPDFPLRLTDAQREYVRNSPKYDVKENATMEDFQPGDIIISPGHIMLYIGEMGTHNGAKLVAADASWHTRVPSYRTTGDVQWMVKQNATRARLKSGGVSSDIAT